MNVIKVHPDGRREKILGYGDLALAAARQMVKAAAEAEASEHPAGTTRLTEQVVPNANGDLRVYSVLVHHHAGEMIARFEEEWDSPNAEEAKTLFERIQALDGHGLVTTDDDMLAETIAELLDVRPEEVYAEYEREGATAEAAGLGDEDDGVAVAPIGTTMVALCTPQGTACAEAGLCSVCDTPERRAEVEAAAVSHNRENPEYDRPVPGEWQDATGNDAVTCQQCGKITVDPGDE